MSRECGALTWGIVKNGNLDNLGTSLSKYDGSLLEEITTVKDLSSNSPSSRETAFKAVISLE